MSDSDERLLAWFLGPKAENAEILERLILEALRDSVFWRRNFHPEDEALITERAKRRPGFEDTLSVLNQEFLSLLAELKRGVPAYSPRYIGHMMSDRLLPSIAAYFAGMLHNPNNVSVEGSATTTRYELEVARQLASLIGYGKRAWGHITSGGTIANIEALWMARNLELLPLAARHAAEDLELEAVPVPAPGAPGGELDLLACEDSWELMNLDVDVALTIPDRVRRAAHERGIPAEDVARALDSNSVSTLGLQGFFEECRKRFEEPAPGIVLVPATAHYSLYKAVEALGIGKGQLQSIPVDSQFRMDLAALRETLETCLRDRVPVYAVVSVLGSTEEGSVDQVHEVVALREEFRKRGLTFFHHCDAAWGGYVKTLFVDAEGRPVEDAGDIVRLLKLWPPDDVFHTFQALHRTDSLAIDPHKLGYVPYPCGTILYRNGRLRHLVRFDAPYIFEDAGRTGGSDDSENSDDSAGRDDSGGRAESGEADGGGEYRHGTDAVRGGDHIGLHILEGSKPGAAAAAAWFAHRVVPLNQDGYGALIGKSIQSAQELYLKLAHDLRARLERAGLRLRVLTDPPDLNLVCFAVNRADNPSLRVMNRLNRAVYDRLRFHDDQVIQPNEFMISSTALRWETYGQAGPDGRSSLHDHLEYLGVSPEELESVGKMRILRCTIMSPWFDLSRGGRPDYVQAFCDSLGRAVEEAVREVVDEA